MGKLVLVGAIAVLLGLFVGGLGPRAELRRVEAELAEARLAASRRGSAATLPLALGVGSLVAAQRQAAAAPGRPAPPRFVKPDPPGREGADTAADAGAGRRFDPQALVAAKAAAELRSAQFRAAFIEQAELGPHGQAALDEAVKVMNGELGRMADELAEQLGSRPRLRPRDMADLGAKVLDIYRRQDDRFKAALDERGRQALERTDFDLLTQVDLGAFERLAERLSTMDLPPGPERP